MARSKRGRSKRKHAPREDQLEKKPSPLRKQAWRWHPGFLVVIVAAGTYLNALGGAYVSDAAELLLNNQALRESKEWLAWFLRDYHWGTLQHDTTLYRPLTILSFLAPLRFFGPSPVVQLVGNVLLHAAVSLLVFFLGRTLVGVAGATAGALLFAVHPLHTEAVAWIAGRAELLAATGALLACVAFLRATAPDEPRRWMYLAATLAAYAGALLSKEHVALLPVWCALLVIVEWPRRPWRWAATGLAGMTGVLAAFLLLRSVAMTRLGPGEHLFDLYNPAAGLPLLERWLTALGVIWRYATLFFWPAGLSIDYSYAQILPSRGLGVQEALGLVLVIALLAAIGWAWRRVSGLALALALAPVTFFLVSNLPFPIGTIMAERVTYLPTVGLCLTAGWLLAKAGLAEPGEKSRSDVAGFAAPLRRSWVAATVMIVLLGALAARAVVRNRDWRDELSIYTAALGVSLRSSNVHAALATQAIARADHTRAMEHAEEALRLFPRNPIAMLVQARYYRATGQLHAAIERLRQVAVFTPRSAEPHEILGILYYATGQPEAAIEAYRRAVQLAPGAAELHTNLGALLTEVGRHAEAESELRRAVQLAPTLFQAHLALGRALLETNRPADALQAYQNAARLDPKQPRPHYGMARAALALGDRGAARAYAGAAAASGMQVPDSFWRALDARP